MEVALKFYLILVLCFFSQTVLASEAYNLNNTQQFRYYLGGTLTTISPGGFGIGHYIEGESSKGTTYLLTQGGIILGTMLLWMSCPRDGFINHKCEGNTKDIIASAQYPFLGIWIWQIVDIWWNGKSYLQNDSKIKSAVLFDPSTSKVFISFQF